MMQRHSPWKIALAAAALLAAAFSASCSRSQRNASDAAQKKLIVLGIDGMDPLLLRQFMDAGKMPHFAALAASGGFLPLATSIPPQSPVAWASIITGTGPGAHGIFDFIHRDPATLTPFFSAAQVKAPEHNLRLGHWVIPISAGKVELLRHGKAFWEFLDERKIPVTVFRIPSNFPPVPGHGQTLAGMGTPDLLGGYGTFSFYTDDPIFTPGPVSGGVVYPVQLSGDRITAVLHGPANSLRQDAPEITVPFTVDRDPTEPAARITLPDGQFILRVGEWSSWKPVKFTFIPGLQSISGICRFYLKQTHPQFELYVSPINIDPLDPALPISTPEHYSRDLARDTGYFHTQGIAEDTKALSSGLLNDDEYLQQARTVFDEQCRLFRHELARFRSGLFFYYFSSLDQNGHMFWRAGDPQFAAFDAELAARHGGVIESYYREMDTLLGEALQAAGTDATVLVISDHGFAPFRRSFNLNTWLVENGYLILRAGAAPGPGRDIFKDADWSKTRAYGLGLNGLYVNLRGREKNGIVNPGAEAEALARQIAAKLLAVRDPRDKQQVITRMDLAAEAYSGAAAGQAPDLIVGYNRGYRVGWDSVLGGIPAAEMEDNTEPWSGDHCMDYTKVPGVVLSNRKILAEHPSLTDIAPTVLSVFGIERSAAMTGHSIFESSPPAKPSAAAAPSAGTRP
ncbi:MAG: alkaline phosphatase family protein [Acidobacteriia bacterium]|nr:alkaline phosphatase family protein [Terriglobia bacterium]